MATTAHYLLQGSWGNRGKESVVENLTGMMEVVETQIQADYVFTVRPSRSA
jgi:hypothetical protein